MNRTVFTFACLTVLVPNLCPAWAEPDEPSSSRPFSSSWCGTSLQRVIRDHLDCPAEDVRRYFKSPESAVETCRTLVRNQDWAALASYYDLSDSNLTRDSLLSGEFFFDDSLPENAGPVSLRRWKHPFPPMYELEFVTPGMTDETVNVTVGFQFEQGGGMWSHTMQTFTLRQSMEGWRMLPVRYLEDLQDRGRGPTDSQLEGARDVNEMYRTVLDVRWDTASGCPTSVHCDPPIPLVGGDLEAAAWELLSIMEPIYQIALHDQDPRSPTLHLVDRFEGAWGNSVRFTFEQRVGSAVIDQSKIQVFVVRGEAGLFGTSISGRAYNDINWHLPAPPLPADNASLVLTLWPEGVWKYAYSRKYDAALPEFPDIVGPHRVLHNQYGHEVHRMPLFGEN